MYSMPEAAAAETGFKRGAECWGPMRAAHSALVQELVRHQVDFDLGDEPVMEELGEVSGQKLKVGQCCYEAVIIPPTAETLLDSTVKLLESFLAAGGRIYTVGGRVPSRVNARPSEAVHGLMARFPSQFVDLPDHAALASRLVADAPPVLPLAEGGVLPEGVQHTCRFHPGGQPVHIFANPGPVGCLLHLKYEGACATVLDPLDGSIERVLQQGGELELSLVPRGLLFLMPGDWAPPASGTGAGKPAVVELDAEGVRATRPNVLVLETCDISAGSWRESGLGVAEANRQMWRRHGFDNSPWFWRTQFRDNLVRSRFGDGTGFCAEYPFEVDAGAVEAVRASLRIAVEYPELYEVTLNGAPLRFDGKEPWLDISVGSAAAGGAVVAGRNKIRVEARPLQIRCEVAPVYVLGDFALRPCADGFVVDAPAALGLGAWEGYGMPFYPWPVEYRYGFTLDRPASRMRVELPEWEGSACRVLLDGQPVGDILYRPLVLDREVAVPAGRHVLSLEVAGHMKNLLGPFFNKGLPICWSWINRPQGYPPGDKYLSTPAGLRKEPTVLFT